MTEISATIRLRPTRIGFLVRPTDLPSVRKIMRYCSCVWGGAYNPIIPVYRTPPTEWKGEVYERANGFAVTQGYIEFFEPDVYVEAEHGLLEKAGLSALRREVTLHPQVVTLKEFLAPKDDRKWSEPTFGLNIHDVLRHIYKSEQQFVRRDKRESILINTDDTIAEAVFGRYPSQADAKYIKSTYHDVFKPVEIEANPEAWLKDFKKNAETPLRVTAY